MQAQKIDYKTYYKVFGLSRKYTWLGKKDVPLVELFNLCDSVSQQDLIHFLIENFTYVDEEKIDIMTKDINNQISKIWRCSESDSILISIADDTKNEVDGSQYGAQLLKNQLGWGEKNFISSIGKGAYLIKDNTNAILFDDFIGSGKTIENKIAYFKKTLEGRKIKNVKLFILSFGCMSATYNKLINKNYSIYSHFVLLKGISDNFSKIKRIQQISDMIFLEKKLADTYKHHNLSTFNFGYKRSEALFSFTELNIPNNVFPIFWWPMLKGQKERKTIFKRAL